MLNMCEFTITKLNPYINNARSHDKSQIAQIVNSIKEFGFVNPILADKDLNVIAGHGRLLAARELGLEQVPVIVLPNLTNAQARALRLADNKIALNSAWDPGLLKLELGDLATMKIETGLEVTGFSTGEINFILCGDKDPDDDTIPATRSETRTLVGDVFELGDHRIGCGDARDLDFLHRVIGDGNQVYTAFLDPPYNVRIQGHANVKRTHREFEMALGEMGEAEFQRFLHDCLGACAGVSRDGAVHFVCMDWAHQDDLRAAADGIYGKQLNLCVWNKSNAGMGSLYRSRHELISVFRVGSAAHLNTVQLGKHGRNRTNVWDYPSVNTFNGSRRADLKLHPTVKPVALVADAILDVSHCGDLVLDVFLGSGSTLIACERTRRRCRGIEIDPAYVDVAVDRWVAMTGGTPRKIPAGTTVAKQGWPS